jgi:hypothetical protein
LHESSTETSECPTDEKGEYAYCGEGEASFPGRPIEWIVEIVGRLRDENDVSPALVLVPRND